MHPKYLLSNLHRDTLSLLPLSAFRRGKKAMSMDRAHRYTYNDLGEVLDHPRRRIEDITLLHTADLIAFPRKVLSDTEWMGYWHLAIVESVDTRNKTIIVIHYQPVFDDSYRSTSRKPNKFDKGVVTRTELDFLNEKIWTVEIDPNYCLPADIVIELARSRIGEKDYDILINNCESFAFWCKTGSNYSSQARTAKKIALQQSSRAIAKVAVKRVAERTVASGLLRSGALSNAAALGTRAVRVPRVGGLFVAADVAVSAGFAARDILKAQRKLKEGQINREEYERAVNTRMAVTAGDMSCSVMGTLLGSALAGPVGAVIGGTIGSGIGHVLGSATATAVFNDDQQ